MGKYTPLEEFLASADKREIRLTFSSIESIIGTPLPPSAYNYRPWWGNDGYHTQASAWINAGFKVDQVDLARQTVLFCKEGVTPVKSIKPNTVAPV